MSCFQQASLDYNAPLLTLAAWKVVTDGSDPYYVQLQAGAHEARKPQGDRPCQDPYAMCASDLPFTLPKQIAVGVAMGIVGIVVLILLLAYGIIYWRKRKAGVVERAPAVSGPRSDTATKEKA
jgi:endoglucanase